MVRVFLVLTQKHFRIYNSAANGLYFFGCGEAVVLCEVCVDY